MVFGYPIRSLGMIFINFSVWVLDGTSMTVDESKIDKKVEELKDEQVSLEWDPSEFPYHFESEEDEDEEEEKGEAGKHRLCKNLDSWQIQLPESTKRGEHKSFFEVLTFWKRKEKVED
ncbi:hypothetical protein F0562_033036 [Nyssa sinensis]|uniref:Uncharacterized protein n=1 Tax=Nyssa sinensis TaxID=561372 RepID=A0A5J5ATV1_9ASTE|nr:hypothetical protein F0562_033036 [Nyssa sinensis]